MSDSHSGRSAYWDNVKAILIVLVVLGHFLLPVCSRGRSVQTVCIWIYTFHMPAFVFVSGYFSKSYVKRGASDASKLAGFLFLYLFFMVALWLLQGLFAGRFSRFSLFTTGAAPWYLMCMFLWYLLIPCCARVRPLPMLLVSVLVGLLIGTDDGAGAFLSLSRCLVFFPFFLAGYHFDGTWLLKIKPWMRAAAGGLLLAAFLGILFRFPSLEPYHPILYAADSYARCSFTDAQGMLVRLVWYVLAGLLVGAVICLAPGQKLFFTYLGERTLSIYILHRLLAYAGQQLGMYDILGEGKKLLFFCVLLSAAVTFLCSGRRTAALFNRVFAWRWGALPAGGTDGKDGTR